MLGSSKWTRARGASASDGPVASARSERSEPRSREQTERSREQTQVALGGSVSIEVGDEAPDFTLKDQNGQEVRLSAFRGVKNVLLVFYPLAFTGTCQGELCSLRDNLNEFVND